MSPADDRSGSTLSGRAGVGLSEVAERMAKATQRLQDQVDQARAKKARQGKPHGSASGKAGFYSYVAGAPCVRVVVGSA